ncbi:flavodoxin [Streptomyces sp. CC53]|uniref:flavodoxin family protein n=1 Tax=unclassified Streptomyces TaxID=2593676 RepID=UPI0008DD918D|nr:MULTISPECIES: NAD(P)H-dependent oxidoreductase [unclassified Streptomyces]OII61840.1 flavodoxin [Streptomyces sp. CC53]
MAAETERTFLFVLGSSRPDGNTEQLTRRAAERLPAGVRQEWADLRQLALPEYVDLRHTGDGTHPAPDGDAKWLMDATLGATDVVIASPLYWYSFSTPVKHYLDHWTGWMRVPGLDFKERMAGKTLWGVSVLAEEDRAVADPLDVALRYTASYMEMRWGGLLLGNGSAPGQVLADEGALAEAEGFFAREPVDAAEAVTAAG